MKGCRALPIAVVLWTAGLSLSMAQNAGTKFEVASFRPSSPGSELSFEFTASGFHAHGAALFWVLMQAYYPRPVSYWRDDRVKNAPAWVMQERYDIEARVSEETAKDLERLSEPEIERRIQPMLQALLIERCHAVVQVTKTDGIFYALTVSSHSKKLLPSGQPSAQTGIALDDGGSMTPFVSPDNGRGLRFSHVSMPVFAEVLSGLGTTGDPPIEDQTGLKEHFDFVLMKLAADTSDAPTRATDWDLASLGLGLKRTREMMPALLVNHIEKPTPN